MKERPILFSGSMVRAILEGRKTVTRRVVKPRRDPDFGCELAPGEIAGEIRDGNYALCPYGVPGDRLWVRETFAIADPDRIPADRHGARAPFTGCQGERSIPWVATYRADGDLDEVWRPSIHMPRWASRITLEVTGVRVERLQDISEEDALAEGCPNSLHLGGGRFARENFAHLWWTINGDGSWEANPWVWVVAFQRIEAGRAAA